MTWFLMGSFQDFQLSFQTNILQRKSISRCKVASFFHESKGGFDRTFCWHPIQKIKITSGCNDVVWIHLKTLQIWLWISDWINLLAILMFENNIIFEHVWKCPNWCDVRPSHVPSLGWSRPVGRECNYRTRFHSHHKRGIAPNAPCRQLPFQSTYAQQFFR